MIWLIIIAAVILLGILPVGIRAEYNGRGAYLSLSIGFLSTRIYPRTHSAKAGKHKRGKSNSAKKSDTTGSDDSKKKGSLSDFWSVVQFVLEVLSDFRRKLRVDDLQLKLTLGGEDPCDLSVNYGRTWAALGSLMPQLERLFVIKNRNVEIACDYLSNTTRIQARIHITITVARLLTIVIYHGLRGFRKYYKHIKQIKGGATT